MGNEMLDGNTAQSRWLCPMCWAWKKDHRINSTSTNDWAPTPSSANAEVWGNSRPANISRTPLKYRRCSSRLWPQRHVESQCSVTGSKNVGSNPVQQQWRHPLGNGFHPQVLRTVLRRPSTVCPAGTSRHSGSCPAPRTHSIIAACSSSSSIGASFHRSFGATRWGAANSAKRINKLPVRRSCAPPVSNSPRSPFFSTP